MLEQLSICRYRVAEPRGENPYSAANQQERLSIHEKKCFQVFRDVVMAMEQKRHRDPQGLVKIVESAYQMNMAGKQRRRSIGGIVERILRDYTPNPLPLEW